MNGLTLSSMADTHSGKFGTCCKDLADALTLPPEKFFRVEDTGVLYLTIGYMPTDKGPGFYDQAVIFFRSAANSFRRRSKSRLRRMLDNQTLHWTGAATVLVIRTLVVGPGQ